MAPIILAAMTLMAFASVPAAAGPRPAADTLALACSGCHGTNSHGQGSTPAIAGRPAEEFVRMMRDFKSGRRRSSIMNRIAAGYQDADFAALAQHYSTR